MLEASQKKVKELEKEVSRLKSQMKSNHLDEVYKENDLMKKELKNMHILMEENDDLREELERVKKMSYEDRVKQVGEENAQLRKRNGALLIQNEDLKNELA